MIREGLTALVELISRGDTPVSMENVGLGGRAYAIGGEVQELPPPLFRREVGSVEDLISCGKTAFDLWAANNENAIESPTAPVIWVWTDGAVLLPAGNDSRESVVFRTSFSCAWAALQAFGDEITLLEQRAFVRLLVHVFEADPAIVTPWRRLDFNRSVLTQGEVSHGKDRLGREINAQASGIGDLPETITVDVPIFREAGQRDRYAVTCKVEIDASSCKIAIVPKASELALLEENHLAGTIREIRNALPDLGVFFGRVL